jgi:hypothetical protein
MKVLKGKAGKTTTEKIAIKTLIQFPSNRNAESTNKRV